MHATIKNQNCNYEKCMLQVKNQDKNYGKCMLQLKIRIVIMENSCYK